MRFELEMEGLENGGYLSLYDRDTGESNEQITLPEGDMREKMKKLFVDEEKQVCTFLSFLSCLLHIPVIQPS
jgi:hypothetical protein